MGLNKKRRSKYDNKIDLPFDVALGRLLAAKPAKKKPATPTRKAKKRTS